jgi:hypothetical protein
MCGFFGCAVSFTLLFDVNARIAMNGSMQRPLLSSDSSGRREKPAKREESSVISNIETAALAATLAQGLGEEGGKRGSERVVDAVRAVNTRSASQRRLAVGVLARWATLLSSSSDGGALMLVANTFQRDCAAVDFTVRQSAARGLGEVLARVLSQENFSASSASGEIDHHLESGALELLRAAAPALRALQSDPSPAVRGVAAVAAAKLVCALGTNVESGVEVDLVGSMFDEDPVLGGGYGSIHRRALRTLTLLARGETSAHAAQCFDLAIRRVLGVLEEQHQGTCRQASVRPASILLRFALDAPTEVQAVYWLEQVHDAVCLGDLDLDDAFLIKSLQSWLHHDSAAIVASVCRVLLAICHFSEQASVDIEAAEVGCCPTVVATCVAQLVCWLAAHRNVSFEPIAAAAETDHLLIWQTIRSVCTHYPELALRSLAGHVADLRPVPGDSDVRIREKCQAIVALTRPSSSLDITTWGDLIFDLLETVLGEQGGGSPSVTHDTQQAAAVAAIRLCRCARPQLDWMGWLVTRVSLHRKGVVLGAPCSPWLDGALLLLGQVVEDVDSPDAESVFQQVLTVVESVLESAFLCGVGENAVPNSDFRCTRIALRNLSDNSRDSLCATLASALQRGSQDASASEEQLAEISRSVLLASRGILTMSQVELLSESAAVGQWSWSTVVESPPTTAKQSVGFAAGATSASATVTVRPLRGSTAWFARSWPEATIVRHVDYQWPQDVTVSMDDLHATLTASQELNAMMFVLARSSERLVLASSVDNFPGVPVVILGVVHADSISRSTQVNLRMLDQHLATVSNQALSRITEQLDQLLQI